MVIKAVTAGYAGGSDIWYMTPEGEVESATIGQQLEWPYFYSDTKLSGYGIVDQNLETVKVLTLNKIDERRLWKIELLSPSLAKQLRTKAKVTAEDDIVYLDRRLGADGQIEWVRPKKVAYTDLESNRETGKLELVGALLNDQYEHFSDPEDYFTVLGQEHYAADTAWNGSKYDFRILSKTPNTRWGQTRHIDSMDLYAKFTSHKTRRGLDVVARREHIGQKLKESEVGQLKYNENDCRIMKGVIDKLDLIGTEYALANETGILPSPDNLRAIAMFENYLMKHRSEFGLWLEGGKGFKKKGDSIEGALVLYGEPGIYDDVLMGDYTSLYPNVVIHGNYQGEGEEVWKILQMLQRSWVTLKEKAGKNTNKTQREAFKTLANGSGYGIFQSSSFRYYCRPLAAYITASARTKLMEMRGIIEQMGFKPLLSDTDSCVVQVPKDKADALLRVVNKRMAPYEIKREFYGKRLIILGSADGKAVKKRYAVLKEDGELVVKGLEMVRSDWSPWARDMQERLLRTMLTVPQNEVSQALTVAVSKEKELLLSGAIPLDDVAITKSIDTEKEYKVKTQHVKAFEKLQHKGEGVISFVTFWLDRRGETFVRNNLTDEQIRAKLDWNAIWKHQAAPIVERLKSCYQAPVRTLEEWEPTVSVRME